MFKKIVPVAIALVIALALVGCSKPAETSSAKYQDYKDAVAAVIASVDKLNTTIDGVKDAAGAAAAIEAFVPEFQAASKAAADVAAKYPELKDQATVPAELKATVDTAMTLGEKLQASVAKLTPYANDKAVVAALAKLSAPVAPAADAAAATSTATSTK